MILAVPFTLTSVYKKPPPPNAAALPPDTGMIEVEMINIKEHPNAKIGGKKMVVDKDSGSSPNRVGELIVDSRLYGLIIKG